MLSSTLTTQSYLPWWLLRMNSRTVKSYIPWWLFRMKSHCEVFTQSYLPWWLLCMNSRTVKCSHKAIFLAEYFVWTVALWSVHTKLSSLMITPLYEQLHHEVSTQSVLNKEAHRVHTNFKTHLANNHWSDLPNHVDMFRQKANFMQLRYVTARWYYY